MQQFANYAQQAGVVFIKEDYLISKEVIKKELKAHIARNIWSERGFYPIYHDIDETFKQSLKLFGKAEEIAMLVK